MPLLNSSPNFDCQCSRAGFKISGQIGLGQKDKLTFLSLSHQIEQSINNGFPEMEIVDVVIMAIEPGFQLRKYLAGKTNLILRSHYQEKGATELYKQRVYKGLQFHGNCFFVGFQCGLSLTAIQTLPNCEGRTA